MITGPHRAMPALQRLSQVWPGRSALSQIEPELRTTLALLRVIALQCRSAARTDLFEACALLSVEGPRAPHAHATALVKGLPTALARTPRFFAPGCKEASFDEMWIIAALGAAQRDDLASFTFLVSSRIKAPHRRHVAHLLRGILIHSDPF